MSDERCRACGAALPEVGEWCTLCFTPVREPEPIREVVTVPAAAEPVVAMADLASVPSAEAESGGAEEAKPARPARHRAEATWPCPRCGDPVAMSLDACGSCGAPFLSGATSALSTRLPVVGDVGKMSNGQRLLVAAGIAVVLVVVLVILAFIGGHIFK